VYKRDECFKHSSTYRFLSDLRDFLSVNFCHGRIIICLREACKVSKIH